ncbi:MAG: glycosyltransferase [Chitinispirillaceae bacterium]|nr:glycosyltransferase [Chitinispirillaceae bacterium]
MNNNTTISSLTMSDSSTETKEHKKSVVFIGKVSYFTDTRIRQECFALAERDIKVFLFCIGEESEKEKRINQNLLLIPLCNYKGKKDSFLSYVIKTIFFGVKSSIRLWKLRKKEDIKAVIVHTLPEWLVLFVAWVKLFSCKLVIDVRDVTVELIESRWNSFLIKPVKFFAVILERICLALCDKVFTANNGFKEALLKRNRKIKEITVLLNTAETSIFKPDQHREFKEIKENLRLIYHGTVAPRFGVLYLIEALPIICKAFPKTEVIIHGVYDKKYRKIIEEKIRSYNISENIKLNSEVPLEKINEIIKNVHIGVVPYRSDYFMNLALSTKLFEYVASGLPVVATRLKSTAELFDDNCIHYAEAGNSQDLADKIIELALNPILRKQKSEAAFKKFISEYSDLIMKQRFVESIKEYF